MKAVGWIENGEVRWLKQDQPAENTTLFVEEPVVAIDDGDPIGYTLEPIYATKRGYITTQAFILCTSCGGAISSNGGPRYNSLCLKCIDKLDVFNKLSQ
jgi:hypothetical protein